MGSSLTLIRKALARYKRESGIWGVQRAKEERQDFLERFPLESWPTMPLERYALGQDTSKDTFSYWMEFATRACGGMGGGSSRKHILYRSHDSGEWRFDTQRYGNVQEAWEHVRNGFMDAFRLANEGKWEDIDEIASIRSGSALRMKALYMYFPDEVLPITSQAHIRDFLEMLGCPEAKERGLGVVALNRTLLRTLREDPELKDWKTKELEPFVFYQLQRHIVKIAPGEDARFWDDCLKNGYICVGWDGIEDLTRFDTYEDYLTEFRSVHSTYYKSERSLERAAKELWWLIRLKPGDKVIANKGISEVLGIGEVIEPAYQWRDDRAEYRHTVTVKWDTTSYPKQIQPNKGWRHTVVKVHQALYDQIESGGNSKPRPPDKPEPIFEEIAEALEARGQVILYGPPGTGKTYTAGRFADWWLTQKSEANADQEASPEGKEPEQAEADGGVPRVTQLTFHASYSYEDFIEGYRPFDNGSGNLSLRLENGVFKRVCHAAKANAQQPYLVFIDEINRANITKVFGELITLLEKDKRGQEVTLPQSKKSFTIPRNVYILATMNTADRSIALLDCALRRRFAFVELMPDYELLKGTKVGNLPLDGFLRKLNEQIAEKDGREKQIGHSFLLESGGKPVTKPEEFARRFRQEILPLLQEYFYDDYSTLARCVGTEIVEERRQAIRKEVVRDPDQLIMALEKQFNGARGTDETGNAAG